MLKRLLAVLFAVAAHGLLVILVWHLFPFLAGWQDQRGKPAGSLGVGEPPGLSRRSDQDQRGEPAGSPGDWWLDLLLVAQFGLLHSLLLYPGGRRRLEKVIPSPLYGCFYTSATCASLLLLILAWRTSPLVCYRLEGAARTTTQIAYVLSWVALVYTLSLTGLGFQTGWTPFWGWLRQGRPPRRSFEVRGAYHWIRHPVYLSFLGQIWFTPLMTVDRLLLAVLFTGYIFLGSYLKDRRLLYYLGETYREYQARVPGYPLGFGPLGRVPLLQGTRDEG